MNEELQGPSRSEVWKMFDQISPTYDLVKRVFTFGLDQIWRKKVCTLLPTNKEMLILDCATGTGDQMIALMEKRPDIAHIVGIDLSEAMLEIGKTKIAKKTYANKISFKAANV